MSVQTGFWKKLFANYHRDRRFEEPRDYRDYKDIRIAIYSLRKATGYERADLARRIGISFHSINLLEGRGGRMSQIHCIKCAEISQEFALFKLAEWFKLEGSMNARSKRTRRLTQETDQPDHFSRDGN